jgi:Flp pilus assembly protein TadG
MNRALSISALIGGEGLVPRFWRGSGGAAAAEFAVVGPLFLVLFIAIIQTVVAFFMQQVLIEATAQAGRLIMTGQAQAASMDAAHFIDTVCGNAAGILDCSKVSVAAQTFDSFQAIAPTNPIQNGAINQGSLPFATGSPGSVVLVQVFYQLPVIVTPFGFNLATLGGNALLTATAVFSNEPFGQGF